MLYNIGSSMQIPDFLSDGNRNVCLISRRLRDIRTNIYLENKGQGQGEKRSCAFRPEMFDSILVFFSEF